MSIFNMVTNLFKKGQQVSHDANEALEDALGTDILKTDIRNAKKKISEETDKIETIQAKVDIQGEDVETMQAEVDRIEAEISGLRTMHDETDDESKKSELLELAKEFRKEIDKDLMPKLTAKKESYDLAIESIKNAEKAIEDQSAIIEDKEMKLDSLEANQSAIEVHNEAEKIANSFGAEKGTGSADRLEKRQREQLQKIKNKSEKKSNKDDKASRLEKIKKEQSGDSPW